MASWLLAMKLTGKLLWAAGSALALLTTLVSTRWAALEHDYLFGPLLLQFCGGSDPCYTQLASDQNVASWSAFVMVGRITFIVTALGALLVLVLVVARLRRQRLVSGPGEVFAGPGEDAVTKIALGALCLLGIGGALGVAFVGLMPPSTSGIGYAFPVFLLACTSALTATWSLRRA